MSAPLPVAVLPRGVRGRAHLLAEAATALLAQLQPGRWCFDPLLLDAHLLLPHVIARANGLAAPEPPAAPVAAPGGGWVSVDLGPDDDATWATLCHVLAEERAAGASPADAEELARRAQEWRLAVTPYRCADQLGGPATTAEGAGHRDVLEVAAALVGHLRPDRSGPPGAAGAPGAATGHPAASGVAGGGVLPLRGVRIIDLTAMWAGPLATWLAAGLGAEVTKVEASFRSDGLRRGPRPAAAGPGPGALFVALDQHKAHRELDLSGPGGLDAFLALVAEADIVIDSFSPRVRPNLGIDAPRLAALRPGLIDVSITAFEPAQPEAEWVAYGSGIHASAGLGVQRDADGARRAVPAPVAYPDPLCGLGAFVILLAAVLARRRAASDPTASDPTASDPAATDPDAPPQEPALASWPPQGRFPLSLAGAVAPIVRGVPSAAAHDPAALERWLRGAAERTVVYDGCRVVPSPFVLEHPSNPAGADR